MTVLTSVWAAHDEARFAQVLVGRQLSDLEVGSDGVMRPLTTHLKLEASARRLIVLRFTRGTGLTVDLTVHSELDRATLLQALASHGVRVGPESLTTGGLRGALLPLVSLMRGRLELNGEPWGIIAWFPEAASCFPVAGQAGTEEEVVALEYACELAQSVTMRAAGNLVLFGTEGGDVPARLHAACTEVRIPLPGTTATSAFIRSALDLYPQAHLAAPLTPELLGKAAVGISNRHLEAAVRAAHLRHGAVSVPELLRARAANLAQASEGTLRVMASDAPAALIGRTVQVPRRVLGKVLECLVQGDARCPTAVLLAGCAASGKTELVRQALGDHQVLGMEMVSAKSRWVGESERLIRRQLDILVEYRAVGFVDEVTDVLPLERASQDADSGVSRGITAALLTALSDPQRRGRSLLVGTTNHPRRMSEAMRSRWLVLCVLHPIISDYPDIVRELLLRVLPNATVKPSVLDDAARAFFSKHASPRDMLTAISTTALLGVHKDEAVLLAAAHETCGTTDARAQQAGDLTAIAACSSAAFFPWADAPAVFPYPQHLAGLVNAKTGEINRDELERRIRELGPVHL